MLVIITGMALAFRFTNPQHVTFTFTSLGGIVTPHDISFVLFQATIAILVLVGFESATAYTGEAKDPKVVPKAIILSLIIQGAFAYLFEYFGAEAWMNTSYTITQNGKTFTGFSAAAVSSAPIGDMVHNLGNVFLGGNGFTLELIVAAIVAAAILGTTLACMNTGVRVTYAISRDTEVPYHLSKLNPKYSTPAIGIWIMTAVAAAIGSFGVLTITNLTSITLLSNFGTFLLYGLTNIVALIAFTKERSSHTKTQSSSNRRLRRQRRHDGYYRVPQLCWRRDFTIGRNLCYSRHRNMVDSRFNLFPRQLKIKAFRFVPIPRQR